MCSAMLNILILFAITLIPTFELRASIPYGILNGTLELPFGITVSGMGEPWLYVFFVCVISNIILGIVLYPIIDRLIKILERIPVIEKFWNKFVIRAQNKIHPYVKKWGTIGVALFIAVPLPGSGSYSGVLGAYLLGISYRKTIIANIIGVTLAGILVTILTITGQSIFNLLF
ncbi:MAG: hypothetical protein COS89_09235 [Deltaproteobacteria bacterium CG07_land_8_20_14_0_80_38_7]|nr:MAG: hypothetical protein COS89_09235 [Deltaproteobacteria bacterium CG07_land_8_20_14_0_80_38_7]